MIASVVATLSDDAGRLEKTLGQFRSSPQIQVGDVTDASRRIPMTIDSPDRDDIEVVTRWIQGCSGVLFVDVVFVHFEDSQEVPPNACNTTAAITKSTSNQEQGSNESVK